MKIGLYIFRHKKIWYNIEETNHISETLRKYPALTFLMRKALKQYTFPDHNLTVPKGQKIWISVYAIHRDPRIYPDPETFDPERFTEENIKNRNPAHYMPFGDGPRNCIGNFLSRILMIQPVFFL